MLYAIWLAEGQLEGCERQHWHQAHDEIMGSASDDSDGQTTTARKKLQSKGARGDAQGTGAMAGALNTGE